MAGGTTVFCLIGELGAGKTTLSQAICEHLGVEDLVNSPSFAIMNEYKASGRRSVYHFDFYRVESEEEAYATGCEDYFFSGGICLIEWPEVVMDLLPSRYLEVRIMHGPESQRTINALKNG